MAEFERPAGSTGTPARPAYGQRSSPLSLAVSPEPMQQAIDGWHRDRPEDFARPVETPAAEDPASVADHAIALHHLLGYGRLAAERDLAALRDRAAKDGGPVLAPLLRQTEARTAQLLQAAPAELHPALSAGLAATRSALEQKAAAIDGFTAERHRLAALEQSVQLDEALLRQDPEQYEILVADAEAMADRLGLEAEAHRGFMGQVRERLAGAAILAELDPVAGDPAHAAEDLARGRFRDAFDAAGIKAWRDLVAANQARAAAEAARVEHNVGIVAEIKMLNRLGAAGRAEGPMPGPGEVETVFPGEGATRLAAAARNRQRTVYAAEIATQPFDRDQAWIEAATGEEDRAIRLEAVQQKHREFAKSGGGTLLKQYPALGAAVEAGVKDPAKLDIAIALYQRQIQKLGVPPEKRGILPGEALAALAKQYQEIPTANAQAYWRDRLEKELGEPRSRTLRRALDGLSAGVRANSRPAMPDAAPSVADADNTETNVSDPATLMVQNVPGWEGRSWAELAAAQHIDPDVLATAELARPGVRGASQPYGYPPRSPLPYRDKLFVGPDGRWWLRPKFSERLNLVEQQTVGQIEKFRAGGANLAADLLELYRAGRGQDHVISSQWMVSFPRGAAAEAKIERHFQEWLKNPNKSDEPSEMIQDDLHTLLADGHEGDEISAHSDWDGRIFGRVFVGAMQSQAFGTAEDGNAWWAIGASILRGSGDFTFRKVGDHLAFEGQVTFTFDEPYDFEAWPIDALLKLAPSELLELEAFRGARRFQTRSQWLRKVVGELAVKDGGIVIERIEWGSHLEPSDIQDKHINEDERRR